MTTFVVIMFPGDEQAANGLQALRGLDAEGVVTLYGAAVLHRDREGGTSVKDHDADAPMGVGVRALVGGLLRIVGGPGAAVPAPTCGPSFTAMHAMFGTRVAEGFLARIAKAFGPGTTAIVAEISEEWRTPLDASMQQLGGRVVRERRDDSVDTQLQRQFRTAQAESAQLRADLADAHGEFAVVVKAAIDRAEAKAKALREVADARTRGLHEEAAAKLRALLRQRMSARVDGKARIEQRLAAVRADELRSSAALTSASQAEALVES